LRDFRFNPLRGSLARTQGQVTTAYWCRHCEAEGGQTVAGFCMEMGRKPYSGSSK
jgi:hypothetical protein